MPSAVVRMATESTGNGGVAGKAKWLKEAFNAKERGEESGTANPGSDLVKDRMNKIWGKKEPEERPSQSANSGSDLVKDRTNKIWGKKEEEHVASGTADPTTDLVKDLQGKIWNKDEVQDDKEDVEKKLFEQYLNKLKK